MPFGRNDYTTNMFHPKKIPQRLMKKYANWEQTPGGILVSLYYLNREKLHFMTLKCMTGPYCMGHVAINVQHSP